MHRRWRVRDYLDEVQIVRAFDVTPEERPLALEPQMASQAFDRLMSRWNVDEYFARNMLLEISREISLFPIHESPARTDRLREIVKDALVRGRLIALRIPRAAITSPPAQEKPAPRAPEALRPNSKHWAEFRFHDAAGRAIDGARYRITLPNGRMVSGTLNTQGTARHDSLPAGSCRVELADIEAADWGAREVETHQPVDLTVETRGIDAGDSVQFRIFRQYSERSGEAVVTEHATIDGAGRARTTWTPSDSQAMSGSFIFEASAGKAWRKSQPLLVHHDVVSAGWSSGVVNAGEDVKLRAELSGVPDGERATVVVYEKCWRKAQDLEAKRIEASVQDGMTTTDFTAAPASTAGERGEVDHVELYFTVETSTLYRVSDLLVVMLGQESNA